MIHGPVRVAFGQIDTEALGPASASLREVTVSLVKFQKRMGFSAAITALAESAIIPPRRTVLITIPLPRTVDPILYQTLPRHKAPDGRPL